MRDSTDLFKFLFEGDTGTFVHKYTNQNQLLKASSNILTRLPTRSYHHPKDWPQVIWRQCCKLPEQERINLSKYFLNLHEQKLYPDVTVIKSYEGMTPPKGLDIYSFIHKLYFDSYTTLHRYKLINKGNSINTDYEATITMMEGHVITVKVMGGINMPGMWFKVSSDKTVLKVNKLTDVPIAIHLISETYKSSI